MVLNTRKTKQIIKVSGERGRMPPPFKHGEEEEQVEKVKSASPMTTWTPKKPQQKLFFLWRFRFAGIQMLKETSSWTLRIPLACSDSLFWPCPKKSTQTSILCQEPANISLIMPLVKADCITVLKILESSATYTLLQLPTSPWQRHLTNRCVNATLHTPVSSTCVISASHADFRLPSTA